MVTAILRVQPPSVIKRSGSRFGIAPFNFSHTHSFSMHVFSRVMVFIYNDTASYPPVLVRRRTS